jgi:hypothetical protein
VTVVDLKRRETITNAWIAFDEPRQRQAPGGDVVQHDRHQRLHPGHARRRVGIGLGPGRLSLARFIDLTSAGPKRLFGLARKGRLAVGYDGESG